MHWLEAFESTVDDSCAGLNTTLDMGDKARVSNAEGGIFKALHSSMVHKDSDGDDSSNPPRSSRMDEALRLREALQNSSSRMSRKLLINELKSPRRGGIQDQFEDTDEDGLYDDDEDFAVASLRGKNLGENDEPNVGTGRLSARSSLLARMDTRSPSSQASKKSDHSVSSRVFQDQLTARFRSTTKSARKMSSVDSTEEKWEQ